MDSNLDSDSSVHGTEAAAFRSSTTSASPNHNDPQCERGPPGEQFIVVESGIMVESGDEPIMVVDRYWRCGHRKGRKVFKLAEHVGGATSYAIRQYRH